MSDFFFKSISKKDDIQLNDLARYASLTTPAYFLSAINRCLHNSKNNRLIATACTSHPSSFSDVLKKFPSEEIGRVVIGSRSDINSNVKFTLDCQIWLAQGVLDVRAHWTACKLIRTEEIMTTLVKPLFDHGLRSRTTLNFDDTDDALLRCENLPVDDSLVVSKICSLAGYPFYQGEEEQLRSLLTQA